MRCDPKEAGIAVAQQEPPGPAPPEKIAPQTNDGSISGAVTTRGALHDGAGASGRSPDLVAATQCARRAGALTLAVQSRRRHFRAWKNARSVAPVPLALRVTNFVAVAVIVTGAVCVSARVRSRRHRWAPNLLQRTAAAPLAITDAQASRQGRRSDNHHDCRAEKQFLHDALPWPRANSTSTGPITVRWWG
jgi:hypothetical protein